MTRRPKQDLLPQAGAAARRMTGFQRDGVHLAPDAALLIRSDGTIADLNLYAEELFGYAREELLGRDLSVLMPTRFRETHAQHFAAYRGGARPRAMGSGMDLWGLRKDGSEFPVDIALTPRQMPDGLHVVCSIRDLSSRLDRAVDEQLRFQTLVTDISARFTGPVLDDVDAEITGAIQQIVEFLGADRGSFAEFSADNSILTVTHTYNLPDVPPTPRTIVNDRLPWLASALLRGEVVNAEAIPEGLPPEAIREREYFKAEGMKTGLAIPLRAGGRFAFAISISSFHCERKWPAGVVSRLQLLGEIFINAIARRRAKQTMQELSGRLIRAQEDERARVARELHDDLSQRLALLAIELEQAGQQMAKSAPEEAAALQGLWEQTREIGTDLHRLSRQLHPSQLEALGLVSALRSFCAESSKQKGLRIEFTHDGVLRELPDDVTLCLYRIVQESLQNAGQHGRARRIDINLVGAPDAIQLTVVDDGVGFDVASQASSPGLGLVSMRERARLVRGEFSVRSEPNQGTRIDVRVPLAGHTP